MFFYRNTSSCQSAFLPETDAPGTPPLCDLPPAPEWPFFPTNSSPTQPPGFPHHRSRKLMKQRNSLPCVVGPIGRQVRGNNRAFHKFMVSSWLSNQLLPITLLHLEVNSSTGTSVCYLGRRGECSLQTEVTYTAQNCVGDGTGMGSSSEQ